MWQCKHCKGKFDLPTGFQKANHSRWCKENPKRSEWNSGQGTVNTFGPFMSFTMECERCNRSFVVEERQKLHPQREKYFCSRKCANNRQDWWNSNAVHYRTIAFQNWKKECAICGFDKIVAIHHIDEDHSNNDPQNLMPLCPNHHEMFHSSWRDEILDLIEKAIRERTTGL